MHSAAEGRGTSGTVKKAKTGIVVNQMNEYYFCTMMVSTPMRRSEHRETDMAEISAFLQRMSFGFLSTKSAAEYPQITPLNFVWTMDALYFHSSRLGNKVAELKADNRVTFCVADEVALVPSYFTSDKLACPATAFFKSVIVYGHALIVEDAEEKIAALSAFMEKLQPEGGYSPFTMNDDEYRRNIKSVLVVKIVPDKISAKFKFGQNRDKDSWEKTRDGLLQRAKPGDSEAVTEMEKRCPFHT